jgi:DNA (cytosine-5)-methyltransferase 1
LFAGAGGLGIGASRAGFKPQAVIEWNKGCCDTIRENRRNRNSAVAQWPDPIEGDVRTFDFRKFEGKLELVTGGPPCQPFSLGGKHRANEDSRDMWSEAVRALREIKPASFIFENVKGLTRNTFATYLSHIVLQMTYPEITANNLEGWESHLKRLEQHHTSRRGNASGLEYRVVFRVLNAANYGIPQRRERVVFVGFRSDLNTKWSFPAETHSKDALLWDKHNCGYWDRHQVGRKDRMIIGSSLDRAVRIGQSEDRPILLPWRTTRDAIGNLPDPECQKEKNHGFLNHYFQAGARSYVGHTGSPLDEPAKTLKAGVHGVPGGENMLLRPDGTVRYFTVRESARLQLGNAVPVELASIVAKDVAMTLNMSREASK